MNTASEEALEAERQREARMKWTEIQKILRPVESEYIAAYPDVEDLMAAKAREVDLRADVLGRHVTVTGRVNPNRRRTT